MQDIKELTLPELEAILKTWGQMPFHARQVLSWIYKRGITDFDDMTDLSLELRRQLKENLYILSSYIKEKFSSSDGTQKFLIGLSDNNFIEAVIIPAKGRVTGCISVQVGCKFSCRFCASGMLGFKRDLTIGEMLEEILYLRKYSSGRLSHIVFMGIGEPLDNYDNVLRAIRIINAPYALSIGARRITVSTCGVIPAIKKLADEGLQIELSVSLHASDDKSRSYLMPINKQYPIKELIKACREYIRKTNRQITFEYILIKGLNSDLQNARNLSRILTGLKCKINIIPANTVREYGIEPPGKTEVLIFKDYLSEQGIAVTLRRARGEDIQAACGQLRLRHEKK